VKKNEKIGLERTDEFPEVKQRQERKKRRGRAGGSTTPDKGREVNRTDITRSVWEAPKGRDNLKRVIRMRKGREKGRRNPKD